MGIVSVSMLIFLTGTNAYLDDAKPEETTRDLGKSVEYFSEYIVLVTMVHMYEPALPSTIQCDPIDLNVISDTLVSV